MDKAFEFFKKAQQFITEDPAVAMEREMRGRDHEILQKFNFMQKAMYVFEGRPGELQMAPVQAYYQDMNARKEDFIGKNGESILAQMAKRAAFVSERPEAADDFAAMVFDLPSLKPARLIEAVCGLALNDWHYIEAIAQNVRQEGAPILTPDQWSEVESANPYRDTTSIQDNQRPSLTHAYVKIAVAMGPNPDETQMIKDHFRQALESQQSVSIDKNNNLR